MEFRGNCQQTAGWYANRRVNEKAAGFKVLIERQSGRILGAHLLGPQADELINVFALAMRADLTADDLREVVFAYPTSASNLGSMLAWCGFPAAPELTAMPSVGPAKRRPCSEAIPDRKSVG